MGFGYVAQALATQLPPFETSIFGTVRSFPALAHPAGADRLTLARFAEDRGAIAEALAESNALLVTIPPSPAGDPALQAFREEILRASRLRWIGYLSTVGVYGNHDGAWVDETAPTRPTSPRLQQRLRAERAWLDLGQTLQTPVHLFRLAGIYGPGRNALTKLQQGTAKRVIRPGLVWNRIHVADLVSILAASLQKPRAGAVYNVSDDLPAPPQDVVTFAAQLLGVEPPPPIRLDAPELSALEQSFYTDHKRVCNRRVKEELGVTLQFPTYHEGLPALWKALPAAGITTLR